MRTGKARAIVGRHCLPRAISPRCVCAFSSSCRSSQHHHEQHQQRDTNAANISYYNRLFAGLGTALDSQEASSSSTSPSSPPSSRYQSRSSGAALSYTPSPSWQGRSRSSLLPNLEARPSNSGDPNVDTFTGPSFLRKRDGDPLATNASSSSNFAQMVNRSRKLDDSTFAASRPNEQNSDVAHHSGRKALNRLSSFPSLPPQNSTTARASPSSSVKWSELLDKIEQTREVKYSAFNPLTQSTSRERSSYPDTSTTSLPPSISEDEVLQDRIYNSQAESRRYSQQLQEEVRELSSPAEAFNWMQSRLFALDNELSLMSKINSNAANFEQQELHHLYADLLVDVTHYLRNTAPQSACLPLALAKAHSPKSYLHGCTAKLYALTIRTKWEVYGDVQGCLELMQDMEKAAVQLNPQIHDYVKNISMAIMVDRMRAQKQVEAEMEVDASSTSQHSESGGPPVMQDEQFGESVQLHDNSTGDDLASTVAATQTAPSEEAIEARLYFSRTQRRALRTMEDLVVRDRRRQLEQRAREDYLQDNISFQTKVGRYASLAEIQAAEEEQATVSDVNAMINKYGKAVTLHLPKVAEPAKLSENVVNRAYWPAISSQEPAFAEAQKGIPNPEPPIDVFAEAVAEVSEAVPRPKRSRKVTNRSKTWVTYASKQKKSSVAKSTKKSQS